MSRPKSELLMFRDATQHSKSTKEAKFRVRVFEAIFRVLELNNADFLQGKGKKTFRKKVLTFESFLTKMGFTLDQELGELFENGFTNQSLNSLLENNNNLKKKYNTIFEELLESLKKNKLPQDTEKFLLKIEKFIYEEGKKFFGKDLRMEYKFYPNQYPRINREGVGQLGFSIDR